MTRDPDLERMILFFVEEHCPPEGGLNKRIEFDGYDKATINAHTERLIKDGLIDGQVIKLLDPGGNEVIVLNLTTAGHDAIDAARNEAAWKRAKKFLSEKGVSVTFGVLVEVLKAEARKHLNLP